MPSRGTHHSTLSICGRFILGDPISVTMPLELDVTLAAPFRHAEIRAVTSEDFTKLGAGVRWMQGEVGATMQGEVGAMMQGEVGAMMQGEVGGMMQGEVGGMMQGEVGATMQGEVGATMQGEVGAMMQGEVGAMMQGEVGAMMQGEVGAMALKRWWWMIHMKWKMVHLKRWCVLKECARYSAGNASS
jgi:hypothetical protein